MEADVSQCKLLIAAAAAAVLLSAASAALAGPDTSSVSATGAVKIIRPITVSVSGTLDFGTVVRPAGAGTSDTVTITNAATSPTRSLSTNNAAVVGTNFSRPDFSISGEAQQNYNLQISTLTLTSGTNTIAVTLYPSLAAGTHTLSGTYPAAATDHLYVGGSIPVSDSTASGSYTGSFTVTVTYN
jgi:spore coat protein U-like protein